MFDSCVGFEGASQNDQDSGSGQRHSKVKNKTQYSCDDEPHIGDHWFFDNVDFYFFRLQR